jgi:hypothetical protein
MMVGGIQDANSVLLREGRYAHLSALSTREMGKSTHSAKEWGPTLRSTHHVFFADSILGLCHLPCKFLALGFGAFFGGWCWSFTGIEVAEWSSSEVRMETVWLVTSRIVKTQDERISTWYASVT